MTNELFAAHAAVKHLYCQVLCDFTALTSPCVLRQTLVRLSVGWVASGLVKVIQGHRFWYQSKAHIRFPISD